MTERSDSFSLPFSARKARRDPWAGTASDAVITANRENARRSTGPRTPEGKAKAARNSLRHGLSRPVLADPALAREVEAAAGRLAGEGASPERHALAVPLAEADVDLARIGRVRQQLTAQLATGRKVEKQLQRIERYERRARFRREFALEDFNAATAGASREGAGQNEAKQNEPAQNEADWRNKPEQNEAAQNEADWQNEPKQNEADRPAAMPQGDRTVASGPIVSAACRAPERSALRPDPHCC